MSHVTLQYDPDPSDGFGRLSASVVTPFFSGTGGTWAHVGHLEHFAKALIGYPLPVAEPPTMVVGYIDLEGDDAVVRITIDASDPRGALTAFVEVADETQASNRVRTSFKTHYPQVEQFQRQLARLASGEAREATLEGS